VRKDSGAPEEDRIERLVTGLIDSDKKARGTERLTSSQRNNLTRWGMGSRPREKWCTRHTTAKESDRKKKMRKEEPLNGKKKGRSPGAHFGFLTPYAFWCEHEDIEPGRSHPSRPGFKKYLRSHPRNDWESFQRGEA